MTLRTTVSKIGAVDVVKIEAEILPTPPRYACDCNECGWGLFAATDRTIAEMHAQAHLDRGHELYDEHDDVK